MIYLKKGIPINEAMRIVRQAYHLNLILSPVFAFQGNSLKHQFGGNVLLKDVVRDNNIHDRGFFIIKGKLITVMPQQRGNAGKVNSTSDFHENSFEKIFLF